MHEWSFFVQNGWIQDGRIQDGCHHQVEWEWMSLSQIKLIWVRVRVEWECFWVNLREITRCLNPKWQCLNPTWLIQDGCHQEVESKWMSKVFLCKRLNLRWLPSSIWVRINEWRFLCKWWEPMNEWSFFVQMVGTNLGKCEGVWEENSDGWIQDDGIQDYRIQDGCHHQFESESMSEVFFSKW